MKPSEDINGVISHLDEIIHHAMETNDRRGYFAAAYRHITQCVRDAIQHRQFQDNARIERLDVIFANRYFDAYTRWDRGEVPTQGWAKAFEAARQDDLMVIQHLMLGMNAHVTFDLGIAAAEVAPGAAIESLRADFDKLNSILVSAGTPVDNALVAITRHWKPEWGRVLELVARVTAPLGKAGSFLLTETWRNMAWNFATRLAGQKAEAKKTLLEQQDREAAHIADALLLGAPLERLMGCDDRGQISENIRILAKA